MMVARLVRNGFPLETVMDMDIQSVSNAYSVVTSDEARDRVEQVPFDQLAAQGDGKTIDKSLRPIRRALGMEKEESLDTAKKRWESGK